jgi:hypothetical protein
MVYTGCSRKDAVCNRFRFRCMHIPGDGTIPQCPFRYIEYTHKCTYGGHAPDQEPEKDARVMRGIPEMPDLRHEPGAEIMRHCDYILKDI